MWANAAGSVKLIVVNRDAGGAASLVTTRDYTVASGYNSLAVSPPIPVIAQNTLFGTNSTVVAFSTTAPNVGGFFNSGLPTTGTTLSPTVSWTMQTRYTIRSGLRAQLVSMQSAADPAGLTALSAADPTGVTDATAIFAAARAARESVYVPPGNFALTTIPNFGHGFYGPGKPFVNGQRFFIPKTPLETTIYNRVRAALSPAIDTGAPLVAITDSIGHWATATTASAHWLNRVARFGNLYSSTGDEPILAQLRDVSTYTPAFYGVTYTGTNTTGTAGPLGESVILASGASLNFTLRLRNDPSLV